MNRTDKQDCHAYEECLFYTKSNLYDIILRKNEDTWTASEKRAVLYYRIILSLFYMSRRKSKYKI